MRKNMSSTSKYFKPTRGKGAAATETDGASPTRDSTQKANLESILAEVSKVSSTLQKVATDVSTIKGTIEELKNAVKATEERLTEAEGRISDVEDSTQQLLHSREQQGKRIEDLWSRVEDLENRSRRNNVRLLGLKEGIEGDNLIECVGKILSEGLGINIDDKEFEIERAHRSPGSPPNEDQPPRLVMVRFLRSTGRDKVLKAARESGGAGWSGCSISLFPDMTKALAERRKTFATAKQLLRDKNVTFRLIFPATLKFTWKGKNRKFDVATEAVKFIEQQITSLP